MKVYTQEDIPDKSEDDPSFSKSVITSTVKDGLLNIGYYDFELKCWSFFGDTGANMEEEKFKWIYSPEELHT